MAEREDRDGLEGAVERLVAERLAALGLTPERLRLLEKLNDPATLAGFEGLVDEAATLHDLALRAIQKRMYVDKAVAGVRKTGFTETEAKLYGLMNSVRSALRIHDAFVKNGASQADRERTAADVVMTRGLLADFRKEHGITDEQLNAFIVGKGSINGRIDIGDAP